MISPHNLSREIFGLWQHQHLHQQTDLSWKAKAPKKRRLAWQKNEVLLCSSKLCAAAAAAPRRQPRRAKPWKKRPCKWQNLGPNCGLCWLVWAQKWGGLFGLGSSVCHFYGEPSSSSWQVRTNTTNSTLVCALSGKVEKVWIAFLFCVELPSNESVGTKCRRGPTAPATVLWHQ